MRDLISGVVVGIVALPLALAFAIASGVPPERGLYTAIVAGLLISALGGSRVQIGGPTGAFVVIVFGIVTKFGYDGLVICTVLAGIILIILGLARMGALLKHSVSRHHRFHLGHRRHHFLLAGERLPRSEDGQRSR